MDNKLLLAHHTSDIFTPVRETEAALINLSQCKIVAHEVMILAGWRTNQSRSTSGEMQWIYEIAGGQPSPWTPYISDLQGLYVNRLETKHKRKEENKSSMLQMATDRGLTGMEESSAESCAWTFPAQLFTRNPNSGLWVRRYDLLVAVICRRETEKGFPAHFKFLRSKGLAQFPVRSSRLFWTWNPEFSSRSER